ncbi:unnamed protein product, partial [Owenia fusiformis]
SGVSWRTLQKLFKSKMSRCSPNDPCSFSRPEEALVKSLHLSLDVDFEAQILKGNVVLEVQRSVEKASSLILDTRDLKIKKVLNNVTGQELKHTLDDAVQAFGSKLQVELDSPDLQSVSVKIEYETSPKSTALQWLKPEQTIGKRQPYLFSQCEAIHARSMVPCQDSPAIKTSYTAEITAPSDIVILMSAERTGNEPCKKDCSKTTYKFNQKVPIPAYLIAIVGGALESRDIGPRSKVWSEKELVDESAYEFAETEQMLQTAEAIAGPYVWGIYDLLVLPPSFPYGGMENPCLTFVTPTLLAGDRSLADVVAHEISHSWTGNLVTNKTFEHFWLNEGYTVFLERKIAGRLHGEPHRHFSAIGGMKALQYEIDIRGADNVLTKLTPDLTGIDPDDAFGTVPYEKGSNLLFYLEQKLGGPDVFEPFLREYIKQYQYKSLDTAEWKTFLYSYFKDKKEILDSVDWDAWFNTPGLPPVKNEFDTSLADACTALAKKWSDASDEDVSSFPASDLESLSSPQRVEFLAQLIMLPPLSKAKVEMMQKLYKFDDVKNSEIRFRWIRLGLRAEFDAAIPLAIDFMNAQGRMKFVRPVHRDLYAWEKARPIAIENFQKHRNEMHTTTAQLLAKDMHLES